MNLLIALRRPQKLLLLSNRNIDLSELLIRGFVNLLEYIATFLLQNLDQGVEDFHSIVGHEGSRGQSKVVTFFRMNAPGIDPRALAIYVGPIEASSAPDLDLASQVPLAPSLLIIYNNAEPNKVVKLFINDITPKDTTNQREELSMTMKNYYDFHPRSVMTLGGGINPNDLASAKARAITFKKLPAEEGALTTDTSVDLVKTSTQLKQTMHVDLSIDANYLVFGGSASFSYDDTYAFDADSVTVVAYTRTEFGRLTMDSAALSTQAQKLIDDGKMKAFADAYGSQYVVMERRGAAVYVLITVSNVSAAAQSKISAGVDGHGGWGPLSASAKMHMQTEMMRAQKEGRINVQVAATGGQGFSGLTDIIKNITGQPDSFTHIMDNVGDFLKQFNVNNSAPIGFHVASMTDFGWVSSEENIWSEEKERRLLALVDAYRHARRKLERVDGILQGQDPVSHTITDDQRQTLQEARGEYDAFLSAVATQYLTCRSSKTLDGCALPDIHLPPDDLIPIRPLPSGTWRVIHGGHVLGISESWTVISKMDNWFLNGNAPWPDGTTLDDINFVVLGKGIYEIDFRLDEELLRSYRFSGYDDSIVLNERADMPMMNSIGDAIKGGRGNATGTFNIVTHDLFGVTSQIDLLNVAWEEYNQPPQKWRIRRYDRIPYGVETATGRTLLFRVTNNFENGHGLSFLDVAPFAISIHDACEQSWEDNKSDCSAFVRNVAKLEGINLAGDADTIMTNIASSDEWTCLEGGQAAADAASSGHLVIGGLKSVDHTPPRKHGHIVVVVPGPLAHAKYPTAYWGSLDGVGRKESTVNYAWNESDRDNVSYYQHHNA